MQNGRFSLTPATVATNPFRMVARPRMVLRSSPGSPASECELTSQLSKTENNIEVDMPPMMRAKRIAGASGNWRSRHEAA